MRPETEALVKGIDERFKESHERSYEAHWKEYWRKVHVKAAIAAMQGLSANPDFTKWSPEEIVVCSISHANLLVEALKKKKEVTK
jgi:anti-sigma-K factor RskA